MRRYKTTDASGEVSLRYASSPQAASYLAGPACVSVETLPDPVTPLTLDATAHTVRQQVQRQRAADSIVRRIIRDR